MRSLYHFIILLPLLMSTSLVSQSELNFVENKGQWPDQVSFRAEMANAALWIEDKGLTFSYLHPEDLAYYHEAFHSDDRATDAEMTCRSHAYRIEFLGAKKAKYQTNEPIKTYFNYYLGKDSSHWVSHAHAFKQILREQLYNGIDISYYSQNGNFKYDLILEPGSDPNQIHLAYHGVDLALEDGSLLLDLSTGKMMELAPYAYQLIDGKRVEVPCHYVINENELTFSFPQGYDRNKILVIDPELVFATYSGSTASNWGFCSAFDDPGNMYAGGVVFQIGYPVTEGAFQTDFWNLQDIGISKYNQEGNDHIYATYLGGSEGRDFPMSFIADSDDNLIVFGTTNASDYPTKLQSYDPDYNGNYDMIITKFNADGSDLIGSSYFGGSGSDGRSQSIVSPTSSDILIGGLYVDDEDMIYLASSTFSTDFPLSDNSQALQGDKDACLIKFNPDISEMIFSRLYGGSGSDVAHSIMIKEGILAVLGNTLSTDFPTTPGVVNENALGGTDVFIMSLNDEGDILYSTYAGHAGEQLSYYVDIGSDASIYICGQHVENSPFPVTEGLYSVEPAHCFIQQFSSDLSLLHKSALVAGGLSKVTAFMVDQCDKLYLSGYGGFHETNNGISPDAIQDTANFQDFYLMVLNAEMDSLLYATYYGGNLSNEHTDGGHSRFDKRGVIYQTVCACADDFPTTVGSIFFDRENDGCSMAAFKLDFDQLGLHLLEQSDDYLFCETGPYMIEFTGGGDELQSHFWDFGDGSQSSEPNPSHLYNSAGVYEVEYIVSDPNSCFLADSSVFIIEIAAREEINPGYEYSIADPCAESLEIELNYTGSDVELVHWYLGDGNQAEGENVDHEYDEVDSYLIQLEVVDLLCDRSENIQFLVDFYEYVSEEEYIIPTIFSPNSDGVNDRFQTIFDLPQSDLASIQTEEVLIYDRWGILVYSGRGNNWYWDGYVDGKKATEGVYFYIINYVNHCAMGAIQQRKGSVTLVR